MQHGVELVDRRALLAQQVQEQPGVERARARAHHHALERREAHRRVDAAAVADRGQRAARAEVAGDQPQLVQRPPEQVRGALRGVLVVDAVEAVAAQPALGATRAGRRRCARPALRPAWNAVSNTATCGTSANSASATATPSSPAALCSGAELADSERTAALTSSVSGAGACEALGRRGRSGARPRRRRPAARAAARARPRRRRPGRGRPRPPTPSRRARRAPRPARPRTGPPSASSTRR